MMLSFKVGKNSGKSPKGRNQCVDERMREWENKMQNPMATSLAFASGGRGSPSLKLRRAKEQKNPKEKIFNRIEYMNTSRRLQTMPLLPTYRRKYIGESALR